MVDNLAIEEALYNLIKVYLTNHDIEIKNLYERVDAEDKIGVFAGISFSEDALPQTNIKMDASGMYKSILVVSARTYALDDGNSQQIWQLAKKLREALHREGLSETLTNLATNQTIIAFLTGPSNTSNDGNIRLLDTSYTIIHQASKN